MNTIRFLLAFICFFYLKSASYSQITDDFSDGNFTQNPVWQGDIANFTVNAAGELQLAAPGAGTSVLVVQGNIPDSAIWTLRFRLAFAPSDNNLLRIFLLADQPDLSVANGYFLEIGETGSLDALRLYRQDTGLKTLLASGQPGLVASNPDIRLRIKRKATGVWEVEAATGNNALQLQCNTVDGIWTGGAGHYFGFQCVYTASNVNKFYFDDVSVLPDVPDTQPPVLISAKADDANTVSAVFNENLDSISASDPAHYTISGGVGQPGSAVLLSDQRTVRLALQTSLPTGNYVLQSEAVQDVSGNESLVQTADFQFVKIDIASEFDVLINEIMADPTPSAGLPEAEWLELFNRSTKTIDLSTLRIQDATGAPVSLPAGLLPPEGYVVLTSVANAAQMQAVTPGIVVGVPFSSTILNNDGDVLTLSDLNGNVIDRVPYNIDWHTDPDKDGGGWSLERINPGLPCLARPNWQSCPVLPGGTPAAQNASFQNTADDTAPRLLSVFPESAGSLLLTFSEGLDKVAAQNTAAYHIEPPRAIASATQLPDDRSAIRLLLSEPLQTSTVYAVTAAPFLADCAGNAVPSTDTAYTGLTEKPDKQDIVVNEIMFNPATGNGRYVEFYNRSNKIFNWPDFFMANFSGGASIAQVAAKRLFLPGQYDVFTAFPNNIRNTFANIHPEHVLDNALPSLADNEGNITLYWSKNGETVVVDSFDYNADFHNALLSTGDRDGVALERINPGAPTNLPSNWTSASPAVTGAPGTPTLPNSQRQLSPSAADDDIIRLPVARLSPDDDGYEDFLDIQYTLPKPGFSGVVTIFDSDGIPVKRLVRQALAGTEGSLRWDGDLDDGSRAKPGIYVLFVELFHPAGDTRRVKKAFAVVQRF